MGTITMRKTSQRTRVSSRCGTFEPTVTICHQFFYAKMRQLDWSTVVRFLLGGCI
jgi:hypothetical protein